MGRCFSTLPFSKVYSYKVVLGLYIINALVFSKGFYCSNVLGKSGISKLKSIQNFAAPIATSTYAQIWSHHTSFRRA